MHGQLGQGEFKNQGLPIEVNNFDLNINEWIVSCVAGKYNSSCLSNSGKVFTWGRGFDNLLGHSYLVENNSFQVLPKIIESLQDKKEKIIQIDTGYNFMIALTSEGKIYSWGSNDVNQCGREELTNPDSLWDRRDRNLNLNVGIVEGNIKNVKIKQIACGKNHCLALSENGSLYAWGSNREGQIGYCLSKTISSPIMLDISEIQGKIKQISCGNTFSAILTEEGKVYTWGLDGYGELGHGKLERHVVKPKIVKIFSSKIIKQISSGDLHMGAISNDGEVFVWGYNREGQCGSGDIIDKSLPICVNDLKGKNAISISCGGAHTTVLMENGNLFIFGRGRENQIGRGDLIESITAYRNKPVEVEYFSKNNYYITNISSGGEHNLVIAQKKI